MRRLSFHIWWSILSIDMIKQKLYTISCKNILYISNNAIVNNIFIFLGKEHQHINGKSSLTSILGSGGAELKSLKDRKAELVFHQLHFLQETTSHVIHFSFDIDFPSLGATWNQLTANLSKSQVVSLSILVISKIHATCTGEDVNMSDSPTDGSLMLLKEQMTSSQTAGVW